MNIHFHTARPLKLLLLTVALYGQSLQPLNNYSVLQDWRVSVAPRDNSSGHIFRLGVCQDGSAYLSDGLGRLIRVDSAGQKVNDQSGIAAIVSTLALACDDSGRAIAGTSRFSSIVALQPQPDGTFAMSSQIKTKPLIIPFDILPLPGQNAYAVLGRSADKNPVHVISLTGEVQSGFGAFIPQLNQNLSVRAGLNGTLLRDESTQAILYLPENPYSLTQFTAAGQSLGDYTRAGGQFHPISLDSQSGLPLPNDRVVRAATTDTGDLLVQVVKHQQTAPMTVSSSTYLEVVDTHLQPKSNPITTTELGHLWGSDKKGNVYFTVISPTEGMNIIKAHVSRVE